ncbi:hypothetical protein A2U01_0018788, partial [Trifolium medium]|nr:hypothetical protein [Trifolium medium]
MKSSSSVAGKFPHPWVNSKSPLNQAIHLSFSKACGIHCMAYV